MDLDYKDTHGVLGNRVVTVLADSPSLTRRELTLAVKFADQWRIPLKVSGGLEQMSL